MTCADTYSGEAACWAACNAHGDPCFVVANRAVRSATLANRTGRPCAPVTDSSSWGCLLDGSVQCAHSFTIRTHYFRNELTSGCVAGCENAFIRFIHSLECQL